jgi:hypothetical protein
MIAVPRMEIPVVLHGRVALDACSMAFTERGGVEI